MNNHWTSHVEFFALLITLLGGFYLIDAKCERQGERTDKTFEIWASTQKEMFQDRIENNSKFYELISKMEQKK